MHVRLTGCTSAGSTVTYVCPKYVAVYRVVPIVPWFSFMPSPGFKLGCPPGQHVVLQS